MVLYTALKTTYHEGWWMWNKQKAFKELHTVPFGWLKHRSTEIYYFMWCSLSRKIWNYFFMNQSAGQKRTQVGNWFGRRLADPHHCHRGSGADRMIRTVHCGHVAAGALILHNHTNSSLNSHELFTLSYDLHDSLRSSFRRPVVIQKEQNIKIADVGSTNWLRCHTLKP